MRQIHEADEKSTHQKRSKNCPAAWKADVLMMKFESEDLWILFKANSEFSELCFFDEVEFHPKLVTEMNSLRCGPFGVAWLVG